MITANPQTPTVNDLTIGPFGWLLYILYVIIVLVQKYTGIIDFYFLMMLDILFILYTGSFMSLKFFVVASVKHAKPLTIRNGWWKYPLFAVAIIFGVYSALISFGTGIVNSFVTIYLCYVGTSAIKYWVEDLLSKNIYMSSYRAIYSSIFAKIKVRISHLDIICFCISITVIMVMLTSGDWLANNICAIAFCLHILKTIYIAKFNVGILIMAMFLIFDVYFVIASNVMLTLATSISGPIKLWYPREDNKIAMLGLGDVIVPGILVAFCLRVDAFNYIRKNYTKDDDSKAVPKNASVFSKPYFTAALMGYLTGFIIAIVMSVKFSVNQPAMIYLLPAIAIGVVLTAVVRGELKAVMGLDEEDAAKKLVVDDKKEEKNPTKRNKHKK